MVHADLPYHARWTPAMGVPNARAKALIEHVEHAAPSVVRERLAVVLPLSQSPEKWDPEIHHIACLIAMAATHAMVEHLLDLAPMVAEAQIMGNLLHGFPEEAILLSMRTLRTQLIATTTVNRLTCRNLEGRWDLTPDAKRELLLGLSIGEQGQRRVSQLGLHVFMGIDQLYASPKPPSRPSRPSRLP